MRTVLIIAMTLGLVLIILSSFFLAWRYSAMGMVGYRDAWKNVITIDHAAELAKDYLGTRGNDDLAIDEIMEFEFNFYIVYYEKSTNMGAFEAIIDKTGMSGMMRMMGFGYIRPEQGPNMMWNTKYGMYPMHGMIGRSNSYGGLAISEEQAREYAQNYLDTYLQGAIAEDVHPFYGYYTIHVVKDSTIYGMLSVNAYSGKVWYHNWHGTYIQSLEIHE